jgi:hypothetical protein
LIKNFQTSSAIIKRERSIMRHDDADQNAEYARRKNLESYEIERKEKEAKQKEKESEDND